jgi:peptidylprolyl isomerase
LEEAISQTVQGRAMNCIGSLSRPPFPATTRTFFNRTGNPTMSTELQIEDLQTGDGKAVVKGALITAHYTGWLEDGTVFDSSVQKGRPFQCVIGTGRVIKGWDLGLMGMRVGGRRKLFVPAHLGYGERTVGRIPANSNLIFEIELLEVLTRDD